MDPPYFGLQKLNPRTQKLVFPPKAAFEAAARDLLVEEDVPIGDPILWAQDLGQRSSENDLVRWWYRDGYVACVFSHLIADGRSGTRSFTDVLRLAEGETVEIPTVHHRFPVARAAMRTYLRDPKALSAVVDIVRPTPNSGGHASAPSRGPSIEADAPPTIRCAVMSEETTRLLDDWGADQQPKIRLAAALVAAFAGALRDEGFRLSPASPYVVWDIRRYGNIQNLEPTNLVGGVALAVDDPADAQQVAAAIRHHTASATPLAGAFCESVFGWRDRRSDRNAGGPPRPDRRETEVPAHVMPSLSVMTDATIENLPWADGDTQRTYVTFINTCVPGVIPLFAVRINNQVHLTAVCRPDATDPDRVQRAVLRLVNNPLELLA
jgi:hypothetical protein